MEEQYSTGGQQNEAVSQAQETVQSEGKGNAPAEKKNTVLLIMIGILIGVLISQAVVLAMLQTKKNRVSTVGLVNGKAMPKETSILDEKTEDKIRLIEDTIDTNYLSDVDQQALRDGIYDGLLDATKDKYADYITTEELAKLEEDTTGIYYGIGAYVGIDKTTGYPKLTGIIENTPAEEAGLKAEDIIVKVDGKDQRGKELSDVVSLMKGEAGTKVVLTIFRHGDRDYRDIEVTRAKVESPSVSYKKIESGVAYIRISSFDTVTSSQFEEKLQQARKDGMRGLLLDLRGNPGGTLESVIRIARMMLPEGLIVYTEDKDGKRKEHRCDGKNQLEVPLVVLVNENTASAAEILAGAVKDYGIGTLVGMNTYGKGIVQKIFYLTDGSALKLTISHYYTPNGNDIHEVGIKPDVEVELDIDKYLDEDIDTQYEKGLSILKDKMKK